eukprot:g1258.t1
MPQELVLCLVFLLAILPLSLSQQDFPLTLVWYAPFFSGGGYCSEATSFALALHSKLQAQGDTLLTRHHGDSFNPDYTKSLRPETRNLLYRLENTNPIKYPTKLIVSICHAEPGAWTIGPYKANYPTSRCPGQFHLNDNNIKQYRIGRTMFETDRLPDGWAERLNFMDEVWVPTLFSKTIFLKGGVKPEKLKVVGELVETSFFKPVVLVERLHPHRAMQELPLLYSLNEQRRPTKSESGINEKVDQKTSCKLRFLSVFKWELRKGWDILFKSYFKAFFTTNDATKEKENLRDFPSVCLYVLTNQYHSDIDWRKEIKNIRDEILSEASTSPEATQKNDATTAWFPPVLWLRPLSDVELRKLYQSVDVLVQPSRGEGWGRPHSEAMASGIPVIATNWSGNTEFMNDQNSYLIRVSHFSTIPDGAFKGHKWAEPDSNHLQEIFETIHDEFAVTHNKDEKVNPTSKSRVKTGSNVGSSTLTSYQLKGIQARKDMVERYSMETMGDVLLGHLNRIRKQHYHPIENSRDDEL